LYDKLLSEPAVLHGQILTRAWAPFSPRNNIYDTFSIRTWPGYNRVVPLCRGSTIVL